MTRDLSSLSSYKPTTSSNDNEKKPLQKIRSSKNPSILTPPSYMPKLNLNIDVRPMASNDAPIDYLTNILRKRSSKCMTSVEDSTLQRKRSSKGTEKSKTLSDKALKKQFKKEKLPKKEK